MCSFFFENKTTQLSSHNFPINIRRPDVIFLNKSFLRILIAVVLIEWLFLMKSHHFPVDPVSVFCMFWQIFSVFSSKYCPVPPVSARTLKVKFADSTIE